MSQKDTLKSLNENSSLKEIQQYIDNIMQMRGFSEQPIQEKLLLLMEEAGELVKAVRKDLPTAFIDNKRLNNYDTVESEVEDVFIVLLAICNKLNIDIYSAFIGKEKKNNERIWNKNR